MTKTTKENVKEALVYFGELSTLDATTILGISGNMFTKYISTLRREDKLPISRRFDKNPANGHRFAVYTLKSS